MHQPTNNGMFERASGVAKATEFDVNGVLMDEVLKGENVRTTDRSLLYALKEFPLPPSHAIEESRPTSSVFLYSPKLLFLSHTFKLFLDFSF